MIYTEMTKKALKLCFEAHKEQVDKSGMPYVFHPFHLAEQMKDEETTIVALLHDVVEDTDYSLEDLRNMGFSENIITAISFMTHDDDVPYMEYVKSIKNNRILKKIGDLIMERTITIEGTASITAKPDWIKIVISIFGESKKYQDAVSLADEKIKSVTDELVSIGFEKEGIPFMLHRQSLPEEIPKEALLIWLQPVKEDIAESMLFRSC